MENNGDNIQVFGGAKAQPKPKEEQKPEGGADPKQTDTNAQQPEGGAKETSKPDGEQKPKEETQQPEGQQKQKPDSQKPSTDKPKDEKPDKPTLKVTFDNEPVKDTKPNDDKPKETSLSDSIVSDFIKEKYGLEFDKISDLSVTKPLPEAVQKFNEYHEKTGRGLSDFYNLHRDWNKESKETVIKEHLKNTTNLSDEDIETQISLIRVTDEDKENLGDREYKKRQLEFSKAYSDALTFMTKQSKEFETPLETKAQTQQAPTAEEIAELYKPYWDQRDASLNDFNEIKFSIDGMGDIQIPIDQEMKDSITAITETEESIIGQWQNKDGSVNTNDLVQDMLWANKAFRQKFIVSIIEQANVLIMDRESKTNRSVNLDKAKPDSSQTVKQNGAVTTFTGANSSEDTNKMGTPLFAQQGK